MQTRYVREAEGVGVPDGMARAGLDVKRLHDEYEAAKANAPDEGTPK